ncbi:MAG: MarC family protein [Flavobacteriales bacterium]|jgi:multiple antibiotic resistance protein|nr:MarC family protein [Flavobacteriales bacterium]MDG1349248.1 MarC family protein [Flavobacteriales bacterium]
MDFSLTETLSATMILFAVIDIIGSIPIILDIKKKSGVVFPAKASLIALILMLLFLFVGEKLILFIGIDVNSFAIAGSFILFALAFEMILGIDIFNNDDATPKTASIVPLAFPIIAGAGSMTTILSLRAEFDTVNIMIAIVLNIALVYIVLKMTSKIERALGDGGVAVLKKVFGIILLAIAVKLFSSNIKILFS